MYIDGWVVLDTIFPLDHPIGTFCSPARCVFGRQPAPRGHNERHRLCGARDNRSTVDEHGRLKRHRVWLSGVTRAGCQVRCGSEHRTQHALPLNLPIEGNGRTQGIQSLEMPTSIFLRSYCPSPYLAASPILLAEKLVFPHCVHLGVSHTMLRARRLGGFDLGLGARGRASDGSTSRGAAIGAVRGLDLEAMEGGRACSANVGW